MLKLDVLDLREINIVEIVLAQLVEEGVTDIRTAQVRVNDYLTKRRLEFKANDEARKSFRKERISNRNQQAEDAEDQKKMLTGIRPCPECDEMMYPIYSGDEETKIIGCKKCRYSEVVK